MAHADRANWRDHASRAARLRPTDADALLRAAAANHRSWFRRNALAGGGRVERAGAVDVTIDGSGATIAFPPSRRVEAAVERIRELRLREASCWSLAPDSALGTRLVARGFGWGWQPHWMALDLARLPDERPRHAVVARRGPIPEDVPYGSGETDPAATIHLAVRRGGEIVGHVAMNPWRRARVIRGAERHRRPRQTALAEAIGFGDLRALAALHPSPAELDQALPGETSPIRLALVTDRLATAGWMLERAPAQAQQRLQPFGGNLPHLAVEWSRPAFVRLALAHGADSGLRDRTWDSTPLQWAEHFARPTLVRLLAADRPR